MFKPAATFRPSLIRYSNNFTKQLATTVNSRLIHVGEKVPSCVVFEDSPGNKIDLIEEIKSGDGKSIVIGVPGAFSPGCTLKHVPQYIENIDKFAIKGFLKFFIISVNDPFVMSAWKDSIFKNFNHNKKVVNKVRFISDSTGELTHLLELGFDATSIFGNERSKRYAMLVKEDGKVENIFIEPDNVSVKVSSADNVLSSMK